MRGSRDFGEMLMDWRGAALPQAIERGSCELIKAGEVFLASDTPRSVDSRYFGAVKVAQIRAAATPLFVW